MNIHPMECALWSGCGTTMSTKAKLCAVWLVVSCETTYCSGVELLQGIHHAAGELHKLGLRCRPAQHHKHRKTNQWLLLDCMCA